MSETYQERVGRYRIVYQYKLNEQMRAEYLAAGIDPENNWSLEWSFDDKDAAEEQLADCLLHFKSRIIA